ncbi:MAG: IclR family transcriptional regulator C-terminal domain-containing protein, partial [Actinomycetes bacterium]
SQGWALVDQELEEGLRSLAAPVRNARGEVVAAVNISAPVRRGKLEDIVRELLPPVLAAAKAIEEDMRHVETESR